MNIPNSFKFSYKHAQIDKSYAKMVAAIALAAAAVIFCLVVSSSLINQIKYQNSVISKRSAAVDQLDKNAKAIDPLVTAYQTFDGSSESVLGTSDKNAKIVLDALPSKYDFPATATSIEYIVQKSGMTMDGISGTDNEATAEQSSAQPTPIEIPFTLSATGSYANAKLLISNLEKSIRPFVISNITLTGSDSSLTVSIEASTYYQPERKLDIKQTIVPGPGGNSVTKTTVKTGSTN